MSAASASANSRPDNLTPVILVLVAMIALGVAFALGAWTKSGQPCPYCQQQPQVRYPSPYYPNGHLPTGSTPPEARSK